MLMRFKLHSLISVFVIRPLESVIAKLPCKNATVYQVSVAQFVGWTGTYLVINTDNIRIYHACEGRIEKIRPKDHRLALRGLPSDDKR